MIWNLPPIILPTVYGDAMSYLEQFAELRKSFVSLAENVETFEDQLINQIDSRLDAFGNELRAELHKELTDEFDEIHKTLDRYEQIIIDYGQQIEEWTDKIWNDWGKFQSEITIRFKAVHESITGLQASFTQALLAFRTEFEEKITRIGELSNQYTDIEISKLEVRISDQLDDIYDRLDKLKFELPDVRNPITGRNDNIQNVLDFMYKMLRYGAYSAEEYDKLGLTAEEYDALQLTALEYDLYAKCIISPYYIDWTVSPFTGERVKLRDLLNDIIKKLNINGKTATEYDSIGYTADEFDESTFTASQQDHDKRITDSEPDTDNKLVEYRKLIWENDNDRLEPTEINMGTQIYDEYEFIVDLSYDLDTYLSYRYDLKPSIGSNIRITYAGDPFSTGGKKLSRQIFLDKLDDDADFIARVQYGYDELQETSGVMVIKQIYGIKKCKQIFMN